ncbi:MAG: hypothetical protein Q9221_002360 [Calogaya cf. arnoldii]
MSQNPAQRPIYAFPGCNTIPKGSLLDKSLTTLAKNIYQSPAAFAGSELPHLPIHLKELLLSYIATHRRIGVTIASLQELLTESNDNENFPARIVTGIRHLDLSHSIGSSISCDGLSNSFAFTSLTHLCLAKPGPEISWSSFLASAQHLPDLTHLSLAYWPIAGTISPEGPCRLKTMKSLSTLSRFLTKLRYLDLEGCWDWIPVLISDDVDWVGDWKDVECLNLSQGPMPIGVSLEGGTETDKWIDREVKARQIGYVIDLWRKIGKLDVSPTQVEHGWSPDNCMIKLLVDRAYERSQFGIRSHLPGTAENRAGRLLEPDL